jgi:hypothetical protein
MVCATAIMHYGDHSSRSLRLPKAACKKESINVTLVTDIFLTLYKLKALAPAGVFSVPGQQGSLF